MTMQFDIASGEMIEPAEYHDVRVPAGANEQTGLRLQTVEEAISLARSGIGLPPDLAEIPVAVFLLRQD